VSRPGITSIIAHITQNLYLTPYNPLYRQLDAPPQLQGWIDHCDEEEMYSPERI